MTPALEICCFSLESCCTAQQACVERVELCTAPYEGGTTPSIGTIIKAREILTSTKLFVMIRPKGGDFLYSDMDFKLMLEEIQNAIKYGADGIVIGLLTKEGKIDIKKSKEIVQFARSLKQTTGITFHRAFDRADVIDKTALNLFSKSKIEERLNEVIETGADRVLTSGFMSTAEEGINNIIQIVQLNSKNINKIEIMAGCGITPDNASKIASTGVDSIHTTAKSYKKGGMRFISPYFNTSDEINLLYANPLIISKIQRILSQK